MPVDTPEGGWTVSTLHEHYSALRTADRELFDERDRRYAEVNVEREKALKIKETADAEALRLARESQAYKDQQNDALRDETLGKSGVYATNASVTKMFDEVKTHLDDALVPVFQFINQFKGAATASSSMNAKQLAWAGLLVAAGVAIMKILGV